MEYNSRIHKASEPEAEGTSAPSRKPQNGPQMIRFRQTRQEDEETVIDLGLLFGELLSKWYWLLLALAVGVGAMFIYTHFFVTPQYQGTSKIYVYSKASISSLALSDLQLGTQLTNDFTIIAKTREVVEEAVARTGLSLEYKKAADKITINNPSSSRILEIVVKDSDPVTAATFSNNMADVLRSRIADVTNSDEPAVVERAVPDYKRVSPSYSRNLLIGALAGFVLAAAIIIILFIRDDTIKSEDDIQKYLGLNTIAMIPVNRSETKSAAAKKAKR